MRTALVIVIVAIGYLMIGSGIAPVIVKGIIDYMIAGGSSDQSFQSPQPPANILLVNQAAPTGNGSSVPPRTADIFGTGQTNARRPQENRLENRLENIRRADQAASASNSSSVPPGTTDVFGTGRTNDTNLVGQRPPTFISLMPPDLTSPPNNQRPHPLSNTPTAGTPTFVQPPLPLRSVIGPYGERLSFVPPPGESWFDLNRMIWQVGDLSNAEIERLALSLGVKVTGSETIAGRRIVTVALPPGTNLRSMIRVLDNNPKISAAPIYRFVVAQAAGATTKSKINPAQYALEKLHLSEIHPPAIGNGVTIAVIDTEVDKKHSELAGAVSEELDTVGGEVAPQVHGTAMVGAISSRDRLLGIAPGAKIMVVRAFGETKDSAEGTTLSILRGLEWAVGQGVQVINMSFTGPRDPLLERSLKVAHDKGVVLIAAAGNAGPNSPPLYPGADPSVIAVTATDNEDRQFRMANEGPYVSVAAPGVEILVPSPGGRYQLLTGTSIASAHVSGVVALLLERDPTLTPDDVRRILESTATDLGPKGRDNQFGWGLVNPQKALEFVSARVAVTNASAKKR